MIFLLLIPKFNPQKSKARINFGKITDQNMKHPIFIALTTLWLLPLTAGAKESSSWWPEQKEPARIVLCTKSNDIAEDNLSMSISGNVARALNAGLTDEGVWIDVGNPNYRSYLSSLAKRTGAERTGKVHTPWELLERYTENGIVKGYVLYDKEIPETVNIATSRAGLLNAVLVDKSIEERVKETGLPKLFDAAGGISERENFLELKDCLNNSHIVIASPKIANNRDFAIAYGSMVYYGVDSLLNEILEWVKPLSPVIGWNCGPESGHIRPCTLYGLVNTVSDFCFNLPMILCSPDDSLNAGQFSSTDPKKIRWNTRKHFWHSFIMSDGDNMQWTLGNFMDSREYWGSEFNSRIPMSYTSCAVNLSMSAYDPLDRLMRSQPKNSTVIEYGGGYYYPDLFAKRRPDREKLLRQLAMKVNEHIHRVGINVFGFICMDLYSEDAMTAYRIFAEELEGIAGMVAIQYSPYNGGKGDIFWVKDREGNEIPVCTAKYQIWANLPLPGSGSPQVIADNINAEVKRGKGPTFGFTIVHAWSKFKRNPDGSVCELPQTDKNGVRGVEPVLWGSEFMDRKVAVVPIDELLWRIRMEHNPSETRKLIENM